MCVCARVGVKSVIQSALHFSSHGQMSNRYIALLHQPAILCIYTCIWFVLIALLVCLTVE